MRIDGSIVHYLLAEEFEVVGEGGATRSLSVDYPILFDSTSDMSGHTVLVPDHERPSADLSMDGSLCVCMGEASAVAAREAGLVVLHVKGATFQRLYNFMQSTFVRMERLDAQLRAYVDTNAGFQSLVGACVRTMGCACALVDEEYRAVFSYDPGGGSGSVLESDVIDLFMASSRYHRMRKSHHVFAMPGTSDLFMKNLFSGNQLVGTLAFRHSGDVLHARYVRSLLGYLSGFVEEMYARMGTFGLGAPSSDRVRSAVRAHIVDGRENAVEIEELLRANGHGESSRYAVLRIERTFTNEGSVELGYLVRRFQLSWPFGYCVIVGNGLLMLADVTDRKAQGEGGYLAGLLVVARDNLSKVGVSREFSDMGQLRSAWAQASIAFEYGAAERPFHWCYRFDDYVFDWILRNVRQDMPVEYVCHPGVSALLRYDEAHGTELLPTLLEFLRCRYNATQAAEALFIARSTLLHRLERIAEVAHIDLDDFSDRVYLGLSFAMLLGEGRMS